MAREAWRSTPLQEAMGEACLNDQAVADAVGATKQEIWRFRTGARPINHVWAKRLAPILGWSWPDLIDGRGKRGPQRSRTPVAARVEAARIAAWGEHLDVASAQSGLRADLITDVEEGKVEPDAAFLLAFSRTSKAPISWFLEGTVEGMPPGMAARIGYYRPEVLQAVLDEEAVPQGQ